MAISVAENLIEVRKRLKKAARKAGRDLSEITIIAATKGIEAKRIKEGIKEGLRVFGENYIQEAQEKIKKIGNKKKKWHFIGHLQKNKARFAVELFDCIHSVDTPGVARELNKRTARPIDVLIQVNITGEKTKHGATPDGALEIARMMPALKNLNLRGLMAIPPAVEPPERSRPYFVTIRRLAERINRERIPGVTVHDLSMGMSSDFDIAIEEGATMVRVGTAIFGPREGAAKEKKAAKGAAVKKKPAGATSAKAVKKPGETKKAPRRAGAAALKKAAEGKKTSATVKGRKSTARVKTVKAAEKTTAKETKKTASKAKATAAKKAVKTTAATAKKAVKAGATKKTALKKKAALPTTKKKTTAAVKKKTTTTAKKPSATKARKAAAPKAATKKATAVKKSAAKVTKKTSKTKVKAAAAKKTSKAGGTKKTVVKKTKKSTATKKKSR